MRGGRGRERGGAMRGVKGVRPLAGVGSAHIKQLFLGALEEGAQKKLPYGSCLYLRRGMSCFLAPPRA